MPAYSRAKIRKFFARSDAAATNAEKGTALEALAEYLFTKVPGLTVVARDRKNVFQTEELDLAFWNEQEPDGLKAFDATLLVECKNWSKPVGSMAVNWFLSKIEQRGERFGVLLAMNGITGDAKDLTDAHKIVANFLPKRIKMVVLTKDDILGLRSSGDLVQTIKRKVCEVVASGTVC
jgi:hypothetical protein